MVAVAVRNDDISAELSFYFLCHNKCTRLYDDNDGFPFNFCLIANIVIDMKSNIYWMSNSPFLMKLNRYLNITAQKQQNNGFGFVPQSTIFFIFGSLHIQNLGEHAVIMTILRNCSVFL